MLKAGRPSKETKRAAGTLSDMSAEKELKRINFDVPIDEFRKLKVYAAKHGLTLRDIFREHIANLVNARA